MPDTPLEQLPTRRSLRLARHAGEQREAQRAPGPRHGTPQTAAQAQLPPQHQTRAQVRAQVQAEAQAQADARVQARAQAQAQAKAEAPAQAQPRIHPPHSTRSSDNRSSGHNFELKHLPVSRSTPETPPPTPAMTANAITPEPQKTPTPLRTKLRRIPAVAAAACSIAGLAGVLMIPSVGVAAEPTGNASLLAQQRLHSGGGQLESANLEALSTVSIEDSGSTGGSFVNFADAKVQYPFASGVPLTDGFGYRSAPVAQFHDAQDFAASFGTPIQAIADGVVSESGFTGDGCGFGLRLKHRIGEQDVESRYCHMQSNSHDLAVGDKVAVGDQVGLVGSTGMSFGPHLHLVITVEGSPVDPLPFLDHHNRTSRAATTR